MRTNEILAVIVKLLLGKRAAAETQLKYQNVEASVWTISGGKMPGGMV